jgi:predicted lipase
MLTAKQLFSECLKGPWLKEGIDTNYKIKVVDNTLYLFFEGSSSSQDWKDNFNIPAIPYKDMPVKWLAHKGFIRSWKAANDNIIAKIKEYNIDNVVIAGFSHGAAIATLAHEDLLFHGFNVKSFVFGCPRVLWLPPNIVKDRFLSLTRYEVRGDIVTIIPPAWLGYIHIGNVKRIGKYSFPWHTNHYPSKYIEAL